MDNDDKKRLLKEIGTARRHRSVMEGYINDCYDYGMLDDRQMVGQTKTCGEARSSDLFDTTFAEAIGDFASAQQDKYLPEYRQWVKAEVAEQTMTDTPVADEEELAEALKAWQKRLYDLIAASPFYEVTEPAFEDMAVSVGAIAIPFTGASRAMTAFPVYSSELLILQNERGEPCGLWFERMMEKDYIKRTFSPNTVEMIEKELPRFKSGQGTDEFKVIQGDHRHWTSPQEVWVMDLVVGDKVIEMRDQNAGVPPMIVPFRWGRGQTMAWPYGPCKKALPLAQLLDELGYNNLLSLGYTSKMALSYENDGQQNFENGIEPGGAYPRRVGSAPPSPIVPATKANDYFEKEQIVDRLERCMYVDNPEQKGKTPPTTTQWIDERSAKERRSGKRRIYRETVMPALRRLAWVFSQRGELPPLELQDKVFTVKFLSPLGQESDAQEVSAGMQLTQTAISVFGETALASIDAHATMENWKKGLNDDTVVLQKPSEQDELIKQMLGEGRNLISDGGSQR